MGRPQWGTNCCILQNSKTGVSSILWRWPVGVVQSCEPIFWISKYSRSLESFFNLLPLWRRGQPVVAMDSQDIPRGRTSPFMDKFRRWTMDTLWAFGLWRFWWNSFTNQVDELPMWIPAGIWTIRQSGQSLDAKGSYGNIHGWFKDGDFRWDPHVSTIDIKRCGPLRSYLSH